MSNTIALPFVRLPIRLLHLQSTKELKPYDVVVYAWIAHLIHEQTGSWKRLHAGVSARLIARQSGLNREALAASINRLTTFEFIQVQSNPNQTPIISLTVGGPSDGPGVARQTGQSPYHEESNTENIYADARARGEISDNPLWQVVAGVIRRNPNAAPSVIHELSYDELLRTDVDFEIHQLHKAVEVLMKKINK